jgi:tetratricopeptide (TPR) repeat protein
MSQKLNNGRKAMKFTSIICALWLTACATVTEIPAKATVPKTPFALLTLGYQQLQASKTEQALQTLLSAHQLCSEKYSSNEGKTLIHRTANEKFYYLLQASFEQTPISIEDGPCAEISYLLGYTYVELNNLINAQKYVTLATEYSPVNAAYLIELAYLYQTQGQIEKALETYQQAEENAENFSPLHLKDEELGRAKRGIGFCLIELGQLDEAESKLNEAIRLNAGDITALEELEYIEVIRSKSR